MPRGRPKGSVNKVKTDLFDNTAEVSKKEKATVVQSKYKKCCLCNSAIYSSPFRINLTSITNVAPWWRISPDKFDVCPKCAHEFSDLVDNWLHKKGMKTRLELKNEVEPDE